MRRRQLGPSLLIVLALSGCGKAKTVVPPSCPNAPVIVISVDTLRSDHLPFYGYQGVETPALSALRAESVLFEKAYAHVPLTLPSHVSLFTGVLPAVHGVHDNLGYRLKAEVPTLAELLKKGGYRTGAAVSAFVLGGGTGASRGFDLYEDGVEPTAADQATSLIQRAGDDTAALLERWIEGQGDAPLFAFLHIYEPHTPYEPAEPFRARYAGQPYDGEIATADAIVGRFLAFLRQRGIYDRALVVFLSDHGESLGEHGEDEHGVFLYRADLQVPLLLKLPKGLLAGTSVKEPVQLTDVFTTVGEATGLAGFPRIDGNVSLVALAAGAKVPARTIFAETYFPRTHFGWADLASALDGRWQYVDAPAPEFFDLDADPAARSNLAGKKPGPFRAMKLDVEKRRAGFEAPGAVGEEEKKKLASLGYLSTGASTGPGRLLDPKDEIGVVQLLREAVGKVKGGRPAEALAFFEQLLKKNPAMLDVWELYSEALLAVGRTDEALAARKKTVELAPPAATLPLLAVANLCLQIGRPDEALRNARLALERGDGAAQEAMARAFLVKGDLASAERAAREGLGQVSTRRLSLLALAHVDGQRKDYPRALSSLDQILAMGGGAPVGVHYLRGDLLARMDREAEAVREFEEEIRLFPSQTQARVGLALVYASSNRMEDARRTLAEMVAKVGTAEAYFRAQRALSFFKDASAAETLRKEGVRRFPSDPRFRKAA